MAEPETSPSFSIARTKSDMTAMKETLRAQQQLLQKLYTELDQEREASATAASEALEMILRLQGEKSAVKMEACHYKRMAEEKIGHFEASLEAYEELIYEKEMEIASLEFQVRAYKHKLLSLGCDFSASEFEFPEDFLLSQQSGENGQSGNMRRLDSMPTIAFKSSFVARQRERSASPVVDLVPPVLEEKIEQEVSPIALGLTRKSMDYFAGGSVNLDSYWNQIRLLDEQVRVISDCTEVEKSAKIGDSRRDRSCSIFSPVCTNADKVNHVEREGANANQSESSLVNVHDVFEVPKTSENQKVIDNETKRIEKWNYEAENRLTKPDCISEGMVEKPVKNDGQKKKGILRVHSEMKAPLIRYNSQNEIQKLNQRIERLEREGISKRQEIREEGNDEEQMRLLKDIQSQLKSIEEEMRSLKPKKPTPVDDDASVGCLREAMLHFWL